MNGAPVSWTVQFGTSLEIHREPVVLDVLNTNQETTD